MAVHISFHANMGCLTDFIFWGVQANVPELEVWKEYIYDIDISLLLVLWFIQFVLSAIKYYNVMMHWSLRSSSFEVSSGTFIPLNILICVYTWHIENGKIMSKRQMVVWLYNLNNFLSVPLHFLILQKLHMLLWFCDSVLVCTADFSEYVIKLHSFRTHS